MMRATACGCDTYTAWLLLTSTTVAPARFDISRCASGGSILSSAVSRYQLGFAFHAASLMVPPSAFTPHGTCESAMNSASSGLTSPANDAGNFALSSIRKPSTGGRIGGTRAPRGGSFISEDTDLPLLSAKAAVLNIPATLRSVSAFVLTAAPHTGPTSVT